MNSFVSVVIVLMALAGSVYYLERSDRSLATQPVSGTQMAFGVIVRIVLTITLVTLAGLCADALGAYL